MRKILLIHIFSLFVTAVFAQLKEVDHWESVFYAGSDFRYRTSNEGNTAGDWRSGSYDDSQWNSGPGGIGYGDGDDGTEVATCISIFIRKQFNIIDREDIKAAIFHIDYDDAFVAWLNGVEIARSAGLTDEFPAYDQLSTTQHEAAIYTGGVPEEFRIAENILESVLVTGQNTLAVQVHNASTTSTDLSSSMWFSVGVGSSARQYLEVPSWFVPPAVFSSNLPLVIIDTENQAAIPDEPKINARMKIIDNGYGLRNYSDDSIAVFSGLTGIELRGNSTQNYPKKPYNFETRMENGENLNVSLLGMPEENDWVLRASYFDHTFIRNSLANHMSGLTERWASRSRHVEVILNGQYIGIYLLMESIKRDKNRVDIANLTATDIAGEDLTGGYIYEISGFNDDFGESRSMKYPKIDDILPVQLDYIATYDNSFREMMRLGYAAYSDPETGYVNYIDVESFLYEMIVQEAMRNSDAYGWSGYFHKDKNGKINAGPVWDFDQSSGNSSYPDNGVVELWMGSHPFTSNTPFFWGLLLNEPLFHYSLKLRWEEMREEKYKTENLFRFIDSIASSLGEAQEREFERWPVLGQYIWRETTGYEQRDTYQKEVDYLKAFLEGRWQWMDEQLAGVGRPANYPSISVNPPADMEEYIDAGTIFLNLDDIFTYPYNTGLRFSAWSSDTTVTITTITDSDYLALGLRDLGNIDIGISAKDIYGNRLSTSFNLNIIANSTGTTGTGLPGDILVYPNPATDQVYIKLRNSLTDPEGIFIYNMQGGLIEEISTSNERYASFDCRHLPGGIYMVVIKMTDGSSFNRKLLIAR